MELRVAHINSGRICLAVAWLSTATAPQAMDGNGLLGGSGLVIVPAAGTLPDGRVVVGVSRIPRLYADKLRPYRRTVYYGAVGLLPFLEATMAFVRPDHYSGGLGDRSAGLRLRLLAERDKLPALAVGIQDFFGAEALELEPAGAQQFAALYLAGGKTFGSVRLHGGYGVDWLPAKSRQLVGLFGAVSVRLNRSLAACVEYDARSLNIGLKLKTFSHFQLALAWWNLQSLCATCAFSFKLQSL